MITQCLAMALFTATTRTAFPSHGPLSFQVKVVGHGKPMILIPGLSCSGDVWDATVEHYKDRYEIRVLTLPGFAGQPPIAAPILPRVRDEVIAYISNQHLDHPVVVGHSLGGMMALWIAATSPKSVGKVVSVDGVPWLPALTNPSATMASATKSGAFLRDSMATMDQAAFVNGMKQSLQYMVTSPSDFDRILATSAKSDPKSVGEAMYELYSTDLRPLMSQVQAPVLMLAEGAFFITPATQKTGLANYEAQIHAIPNHTLRMSFKARHFIMFDDPEFFFKQIDSFL